MVRHSVKQAIKGVHEKIEDCLHTLLEYTENDFGIDDATVDADENPYKLLLKHLTVSYSYVSELGDWINRGAPNQR